MSTIMLF